MPIFDRGKPAEPGQEPAAGAADDAGPNPAGPIEGVELTEEGAAVAVAAVSGEIINRESAQFVGPVHASYDALIDASIPVRDVTGELDIAKKDELIGVPFLVLDWLFRPSEFEGEPSKGDPRPGEYVSIKYVTASNDVGVFNDGGTGIKRALHNAEHWPPECLNPGAAVALDEPCCERWDADRRIMLNVGKGLKRSDYDKPGVGPAHTFYFA